MKRTIQLFAQRYENYGFHEGRDCWKPKGGHVFELDVDFDWLMYADEQDRNAIFAKVVSAQSTAYEKFEYVDFELAPSVSKISVKEFNRVHKAHHNS